MKTHWREPEAIFWTYGFPLLLVVGLGIAFQTLERRPVALDVVEGPAAERVLETLQDNPSFEVTARASSVAFRLLRRNQTPVVVSVSESGAYEYHYDPSNPEAEAARASIDDALQRAAGRQDPLETDAVPVTTPGSRYVDWLGPGLIGMTLMGGGMWEIGFVLVDMRLKKLLKRLVGAPMRKTHFLLSLVGTRVLFFIPESLFLLGAAHLIFKITIQGSLLAVFVVAFTGAITFSGLGLLVACRAQRIETISGLMNLVMLPMWLCSGIFFSSERFPELMQPFVQALPLTQLIDALRAIILEGQALLSQVSSLGILALWAGGSCVLALAGPEVAPMEMKKSSNLSVDPEKFENIHQVGGIRTGTLDWPDAGGAAGCRVALVNTGSPLRFSVAVDRGGDIVEAFYGHTSLAYLTPNGFRPPSPMLHRDEEWLRNWPGGLVTSCGPRYIGPGREEDGQQLYLHGPFSNTTAALVALHNPDVRAGDSEMSLEMVIRDTRLYGPVVEVRRRWSCRLGQPEIRLEDRVNNRGNTSVAHNWLYHINLGYPLLDEGAEFVYSGRVNGGWEMGPNLSMAELSRDERDFNRFLRVPGPLPDHVGTNSQGLVLDVDADSQGVARVGLVNPRLQLAFSIEYRRESLPRLANWQHYGPAGDYVSALEPFSGSLFGKDEDRHPQAAQWLEPGESKVYQLTIRVLESPAAVESFRSQRGELISDL